MIVDTKEKMQFVEEKFNTIQLKLWNKNSKAEKHFCDLLNKAKIPHFREKGNYKFNTRWCYYDFYIPTLRLYVEIDGEEHKLREKQIIDRDKEIIIKKKHRYLLRLSNEYVLSKTSMTEKKLIKLLICSKPDKCRFYFKRNYLKNIEDNYNKSIEDMKLNANFEIDENKKIFCYDNKSGEYYEFKNIFEAKMVTELSINHLNDLINIENKKSTSRRWVFGLTMKECEFNVMKVYGL